jgi:hypothetical protein
MIIKRPIWKEVVAMSVGLAIVVTGIALTACGIANAGVPLLVIGAVVAGLAYMEITCKRR